MTSRVEIQDLVRTKGVVASRELSPTQARMLSRMHREGVLARLLPGIYCAAAAAEDLRTRCAAVSLWDPDAVVTGLAAARLTFWPSAPATVIDVATRRKRSAPAWLKLTRRVLDPSDVIELSGVRVSRAAYTAVDRASHDSGETIDAALRARVVELDDLHETLARNQSRAGNLQRRLIVKESRSNPWSQGERLLHRSLHAAGIKGWVANHPVRADGRRFFLDVAFPGLKLAIEVDGREAHGLAAFEADRERQNVLFAEGGWVLLRVTWAMLQDPPRLIALIKRALTRARRQTRRST